MSSLKLTTVFIQIITAALIIQQTIADTDWMQSCGKCRCKWNSGKKYADCRNVSYLEIPDNLSSDMQVLDFSFNTIAELRRDDFIKSNLENLHKLYLKNCTLEEIDKNALHGLTILIELDLSNNFLAELQPGTFSDLVKLRTLLLNNNEIKVLEDRIFENLKFLHKIELKENHIVSIGQNSFVNLPALTQISLEWNRLNTLRKESFQNLDKLTSLSIGSNPWNCTCELRQFRDFIIDKNLYTQPDCNEPKNLKGKLWSELKSDDFACKPRILLQRAGASVEASNENVTLTCRIKGWPTPKVSWIYNKRPVNEYDRRIIIRDSVERNTRETSEVFTSDLTIFNVKNADKGAYTCVAKNNGGSDEAILMLTVPGAVIEKGAISEQSNNFLLIIIIVIVSLFIILLITVAILCCYCKKVRKYNKNGSMSENGLVSIKMDKSHQDSMLEGGSVIMEMQKSLLTEVNPVEKPPRRNDVESTENDDLHDGADVKRTLLDETNFGNDDETQSIALSDSIPRSRQAYVDDSYGTALPPDLLTFPSRFPQSPSLQSSLSHIPDNRLYGKSPLSSPIYQHNPNVIYSSQMTPSSGFRTLQHPKNVRQLSYPTNRSNSPFTPAPIIYPPVNMKSGYVTIPRKARIPSWTPSMNSTVSDFPPQSPESMMSGDYVEPVYDNLGLRTTAGGNSALNINKLGLTPVKYTMKDRPLPATPSNPSGLPLTYEPIQETSPLVSGGKSSDTEPLFGNVKQNNNPTITPSSEKLTKIPPRPPPKPKKKLVAQPSNNVGNTGSKSQLFDDECEDGTEV